MAWFHRKSKSIPQASLKELMEVENRLRAQIKDVKSSIRLLQNEWNDTYQKLAKLYDRTRKAQSALLKKETEAENAPDPSPNGLAEPTDLEAAYYRTRL